MVNVLLQYTIGSNIKQSSYNTEHLWKIPELWGFFQLFDPWKWMFGYYHSNTPGHSQSYFSFDCNLIKNSNVFTVQQERHKPACMKFSSALFTYTELQLLSANTHKTSIPSKTLFSFFNLNWQWMVSDATDILFTAITSFPNSTAIWTGYTGSCIFCVWKA